MPLGQRLGSLKLADKRSTGTGLNFGILSVNMRRGRSKASAPTLAPLSVRRRKWVRRMVRTDAAVPHMIPVEQEPANPAELRVPDAGADSARELLMRHALESMNCIP